MTDDPAKATRFREIVTAWLGDACWSERDKDALRWALSELAGPAVSPNPAKAVERLEENVARQLAHIGEMVADQAERFPLDAAEQDAQRIMYERQAATAVNLKDLRALIADYRTLTKLAADREDDLRGKVVLSSEALEELRRGRDWRPIEEAPRDGSGVIVALPIEDRVVVGEAHWVADGGDDGDWWWANLGPGDYYANPISQPTHWQPLPETPK